MRKNRYKQYDDDYDDDDDDEEEDKKWAERRAKERKRRTRRFFWKLFSFFFTIALLIVALAGGFYFSRTYLFPDESAVVLSGDTVTIVIPAGASTEGIATILHNANLIPNVLMFRIQSRIDGFDGTYQQGTYQVDRGLTMSQIMELLQTGVVMQEGVWITIPEGYTTVQIANKVEELGIASAAEFVAATKTGNHAVEYDFLYDLPDREMPLEGYLFPQTYVIQEGDTVDALIHLMLQEFQRVYESEMRPLLEASGLEYTLDEFVTMASIVEKEIVVTEERPRAAGVIYNRLNRGMQLQMDATVLYAMGIVKEDVTYADLEFDSPYNTYKVAALPIGPISNPGKESLLAVVQPESHNYLYYVLEKRGASNHVYTETYDEFLTAKNNYLASKAE